MQKNPDLCSLGYMSVDDIVVQVPRMGRGSEMAKIDVRQAYRNIGHAIGGKSRRGASYIYYLPGV